MKKESIKSLKKEILSLEEENKRNISAERRIENERKINDLNSNVEVLKNYYSSIFSLIFSSLCLLFNVGVLLSFVLRR